MTVPDQYPSGWSINGELASAADLAVMEQLAQDLVAKVPFEENKQYGYRTEADSIALFRTIGYENEAALGTYAVVQIACGDYDNVKLGLTYGYDNHLSDLFLGSEEELGEVNAAIQDLLETGQLTSPDDAILRHVQTAVLCMMGAIDPELATVAQDQPSQPISVFAEIIRQQVAARVSSTLCTKGHDVLVGSEQQITVVHNTLTSQASLDKEHLLWLPLLKITYTDRNSMEGLCYTKYQDGDVTLEAVDGSSDEKSDDEVVEAEETEIDEDTLEHEAEVQLFLMELGINDPSKAHVVLLTQKLVEAAFIDAGLSTAD